MGTRAYEEEHQSTFETYHVMAMNPSIDLNVAQHPASDRWTAHGLSVDQLEEVLGIMRECNTDEMTNER